MRKDQQSLRYLILQRKINVEYQKWVRKLLGFEFEVQFKPVIANRVADALSRKNGEPISLGTLTTSTEIN